MCPLIFTRRATRRAPPVSPNDHALEPIHIDQSVNQLSLPFHSTIPPQETGLNRSHRPGEFHNQHSLISASVAQGISGLASDNLSEQIVTSLQSTVGDPLTPGLLRIQSNTSVQDPSVEENVESHGHSQRANWWYCHICSNGPQGLQTPSCTGVIAGNICGHVRCSLCRME